MIKMFYKLMVFCILLVTGCEKLVQENDKNLNVEDFEEAWQLVDSIYPYLAFKEINWDSIYYIFKPLVYEAQGDEFLSILSDLLKVLKDGHVLFKTKGGSPIIPYISPREIKDRNLFDPVVVRKYFDTRFKLDEKAKMEYNITSDNIGYLYIATFKKDSWKESCLNKALDYLKNTNGLIIDVRSNGGGSSMMYNLLIRKIIASPISNLPYKVDGVWGERVTINPKNGLNYLKPIVILINGTSFSAAEGFAAIAHQIPHVTLIGDTTAGASGEPKWFKLPSGSSIRICTKYFCRPDSIPMEWNGVPPDIRIEQSENDIKNGVDKQLEYAINYLSKL